MLNWSLLIPEYILGAGAVGFLAVESFSSKPRCKRAGGIATIAIMVLSLIAMFVVAKGQNTDAYYGLLAIDSLSFFIKLIILLGSITVTLIFLRTDELDAHFSEYYAMFLTVVLGCFFMASANNLLMLYLGIEMASIVSYIMSGIKKFDDRSNEAALKYVVYGSLASAVMIFGMSYLYGITGSLSFAEINAALVSQTISSEIVWLTLALIFCGLGYKVSAAPFHMWAPDVYEGSPLPVTAFFSIVPKAAAVGAIARVFFAIYSKWDSSTGGFAPLASIDWTTALSVLAVLTMFAGNLAALHQTNMKRLLAFSSISHAGFLIFGFASQDTNGINATMFYLVIYYFMNMGAFWVASEVKNWTGTESIDGFRGLGLRSPVIAILMTGFLFSLVGLPPFAGFIGKWYVFAVVIKKGMYGAAVAAAVNSVIALFYYAKIVRIMFFDKAPEATPGASGAYALTLTSTTVLVLLSIPTLILGIYWEPVYNITKMAASMFGVG